MVDFNYRSMHTVLIYLNTCEGGGGTRFYTDNQVTTLRPDESGRWVSQPLQSPPPPPKMTLRHCRDRHLSCILRHLGRVFARCALWSLVRECTYCSS